MKVSKMPTLTKVVLTGIAFTFLPACSPAGVRPPSDNVAAAFETSGIVAVKPYDRTIFSTHNF